MQILIKEYIEKLNRLYKTGNAREHSYRGDLQVLINTIVTDVLVTNEPARTECGAPDYIITKRVSSHFLRGLCRKY